MIDSRNANSQGLTFWIHWLVGISSTVITFCALTYLKTGEISEAYRALAAFIVLASIPAFSSAHAYHKRLGYLSGLAHLLLGWLILLAALIAITFITKTSASFSREVVLVWAVLGFIALAVPYLVLSVLFKRHYQRQRSERTALIIGTGDLAQLLAETIVKQRSEPLIGLVATHDEPIADNGLFPIVGSLAYLRNLLEQHEIKRLYIALPLEEMHNIDSLYIDLLDTHVDITWVPDLNSLMLLNHSVSEINGLPAIHLNESPLTSYPTSALVKAILDRSSALLAIIVLSPLLLCIAMLIKLSSPGPVLFKQQRHGWNGKVFTMWKFRSMRVHDDSQVKQATRHDPRITPIGRFIRRTSIDELPQLFNVLQGKMSLVGPRPHAVAHNNYYTGKIRAYMLRHRIKPGITGWAQINGCRGETETLDKMQKRVELDLAYINKWSIWLDIKIIIKTPFTLFSKDVY